MLRCTQKFFASKVSGGSARNQAGSPRKKAKQFHVFLNAPVSNVEVIKEQRHRYGQDKFSRKPEFRAGRNVHMDSRFTLRAVRNGIVSIAKSKINPSAMKWVNVDPDIQKVRRSNELRTELEQRGAVTYMTRNNEEYTSELDTMREPRWRERVLSVKKKTERYVDPNLFSRGMVDGLRPMKRFDIE